MIVNDEDGDEEFAPVKTKHFELLDGEEAYLIIPPDRAIVVEMLGTQSVYLRLVSSLGIAV